MLLNNSKDNFNTKVWIWSDIWLDTVRYSLHMHFSRKFRKFHFSADSLQLQVFTLLQRSQPHHFSHPSLFPSVESGLKQFVDACIFAQAADKFCLLDCSL